MFTSMFLFFVLGGGDNWIAGKNRRENKHPFVTSVSGLKGKVSTVSLVRMRSSKRSSSHPSESRCESLSPLAFS